MDPHKTPDEMRAPRLWKVRALCGSLSLIGLAVLLSGCHMPDATGERPRAMVAAARANRITLFGDLNETVEASYYSRTAVSLRRHSFTELGGDFDAALDAEGRRLVFASTRHSHNPDLYIKGVDGVAVMQLTSDPASDILPAISPDGTRVAFTSDRSGNWDIWVVGVDGGPPVQITHALANEIHPSWSSDGTQLVFCSLPQGGGQWELWITDARVGGTQRFIGDGLFPEWAPATDIILFQRSRERGSRLFGIWTLTLVDGEPRYPTELASSPYEAVIQPTWSRDGTRVAYVTVPAKTPVGATASGVSDRSDVWVMGVDGRRKLRLTDGQTANFAPAFSPDGRVFFTTNRSGRENIWSVLPASGSSGGSGLGFLTGGVTTPARSQGVDQEVRVQTTSVNEGL